MADSDLVCVKGLAEFQKALEEMPANIAKNVLRGAVAAGAKVIQAAAVELAPVYEGDDPRPSPGRIKNAIYVKQIPELSNQLLQTYFVGVRRGKKQQIKIVKGKLTNLDAYYWTWVEFGHWYVPRKPAGLTQEANRKFARVSSAAIWVEPRPFMKPAFALARDKAIEAMVAYFENRIPVEAAKLGFEMK